MTKLKGLIQFIVQIFSEFGILLVLLALIAFFSLMTIQESQSVGAAAAKELAEKIQHPRMQLRVAIVASGSETDQEMVAALKSLLEGKGYLVYKTINGGPPDAARAFQELDSAGLVLDYIAVTQNIANWSVIAQSAQKYASCRQAEIVQPATHKWPRFLSADNIRNIADRISVIAILAIGMTMVIITAGIDLSVGSLIALAAVLCALMIRQFGGGISAMWMAAFCAILFCGLMGFFSGILSTHFKITPFIATLAVMMIARGLAYKFSNVTTIPIEEAAFGWLGKGRVIGIPVSVICMGSLYGIAYFVMHHTVLGRRIYAIGGNAEAARLSGVPVQKVLLIVYTICGLLAGLGGVITASNLAGGAATYGDYYELYTIAAVVVGGTSLMGGEGKIMGTLIGAFIIAVIQSGMNQLGVESNTQKVVFGLVIVGAILSDKYKRGEISLLKLGILIGTVALVGLLIYLFLRYTYPENFL